MAGLKSVPFKTKTSDCTIKGAKMEMEILSQCGDSTLKDIKFSMMNHGKGVLPNVRQTHSVNRAGHCRDQRTYWRIQGNARSPEIDEALTSGLRNNRYIACYLENVLRETMIAQKRYQTLTFMEMVASLP